VHRSWHDNGQLELEENFLHDKKHGVCRQWDDKGQLWRDEEWFYGNRIR
jgi:antitoxin component YwqK of YwqJK toxin-antitoxin module